MVAKRFGLAVLVVVTILAMAPLASAQNAGIFCTAAQPTCGVGCNPCGQGFWMGLGVRKFINSFTSFQVSPNIGIRVPVGRERSEWPLDQWYGAAKLGYCRGPVGVVVDYMATLSSGSGTRAQETSWDPTDGTVILFGKGNSKPRGSVVDIAATWTLPIPASKCEESPFAVAAVVGYRHQNFKFSLANLTDNFPNGGVLRFPGIDLEFAQHYDHWYIGGILTRSIDLGSLMGRGGSCDPSYGFVCSIQADYAYVRANNNADDFVHWVLVPERKILLARPTISAPKADACISTPAWLWTRVSASRSSWRVISRGSPHTGSRN